jgi:hypothetical protein
MIIKFSFRHFLIAHATYYLKTTLIFIELNLKKSDCITLLEGFVRSVPVLFSSGSDLTPTLRLVDG